MISKCLWEATTTTNWGSFCNVIELHLRSGRSEIVKFKWEELFLPVPFLQENVWERLLHIVLRFFSTPSLSQFRTLVSGHKSRILHTVAQDFFTFLRGKVNSYTFSAVVTRKKSNDTDNFERTCSSEIQLFRNHEVWLYNFEQLQREWETLAEHFHFLHMRQKRWKTPQMGNVQRVL